MRYLALTDAASQDGSAAAEAIIWGVIGVLFAGAVIWAIVSRVRRERNERFEDRDN